MARHIDLIADFVAGIDHDVFLAETRTVYAVVRCLEIISEASRRLPEDLKLRHPTIAWKQMAGAGNVYRHDYEDVSARLVWQTIQHDIPALRQAIQDELARLDKA
jgi:uncharacterized protein with HEPN domain